jgi:hypothetical protein
MLSVKVVFRLFVYIPSIMSETFEVESDDNNYEECVICFKQL